MIMTQKEIYDYLSANPLGTPVSVGEIDDLNGGDYIFLDYEGAELITFDDHGVYQTMIEITVATRTFEDRKTLTKYVLDKFNLSVNYYKADDFEYYIANCNGGLILYEPS